MDTVQWPQEIVVKPLEEIVTNTCPKPLLPQSPPRPANSSAAIGGAAAAADIRKARPQKDQALNCPRCNSTNTKFCYYNNYSLSQPRYFCKTCRRYWTAGGSLRNIPVGGGSRKNKRSSSSSTSNPLSTNSSPQPLKKQITTTTTSLTGQNPRFQDTQDLNLGFPHGYRSNFTDMIQNIGNNNDNNNSPKNGLLVANGSCSTTSSTITSTHLSGMDLLNGNNNNNNNNSFMGFPMHNYHHNHQQDPSGFIGNNISMQDFNKPTTLLGFSLDGINGGGSGFHQQLSAVQEEAVNNGRSLFPFEDLKLPVVSSGSGDIDNQKQGDASGGYWTGMLSGGSW